MAANISEFLCKKLFFAFIKKDCSIIRFNKKNELPNLSGQFICKVDQNIKSRMKKGLIKIGTMEQIKDWVQNIKFDNFIVEQFHSNVESETYLLIRDREIFILENNGGINVGNLSDRTDIKKINDISNPELVSAINTLYDFYLKYNLTFLEVNPLAKINQKYIPLDMLAKYDLCSTYLFSEYDRLMFEEDSEIFNTNTPEEKIIESLGKKTGSSLKFKLLNPNSKIWFILFGGGASVAFFDKWIGMINKNKELFPANYGEISGNPPKHLVREYVEQLFSLISKSLASNIKLIIGGGVANFTLVDKTFEGIVEAIDSYNQILREKQTKIFVRRAGPNDTIGLKMIEECSDRNGLWIETHGKELGLTAILDKIGEPNITYKTIKVGTFNKEFVSCPMYNFTSNTKCFILGSSSQISVAQNMLDFDFFTGRDPSVKGFIDLTRSNISNQQLFWGKKSILIPIYPSIQIALEKDNVDGIINFSSHRAAFDSSEKILQTNKVKFLTILAEGMAENQTRILVQLAREKGIMLLGPSTVGGIFPERFRIGNAGGKLDLLLSTGLHKRGIVGICTKSGGLLNELSWICSKVGLGVSCSLAIGGDRFGGVDFASVVMMFESDPRVQIILMVGEVGGEQEMMVGKLVLDGIVKKKIIGLCLGTSASAEELGTDFQFGHAGAMASVYTESALYKNSFMKKCGILVPESWEGIEQMLSIENEKKIFVSDQVANVEEFLKQRIVPNFFSSISSERGEELLYGKRPVSQIESIGQVLGLLWFKKDLPRELTEYMQKVLIVCADHGPNVCGAQNTMVTSRAGKDMVSSLCSGLLTIGGKFGGAINEAAKQFFLAKKNGIGAEQFVRAQKTISGIGHKFYSMENPDQRVQMLNSYAKEHFLIRTYTDFALEVEKITLKKKSNLILNVDGFIAVSMIDGFLSGGFELEEIESMIDDGVWNGFFILARTIGFIGHHIDQRRLKQDLYRAKDLDVEIID